MPTPSEKPTSKDFHTLGLEPEAQITEVKRAYRDLAKRWHPDRFQQRSHLERKKAEERFKEITGAYRRISRGVKSSGKRPRHDASASSRESRTAAREFNEKPEHREEAFSPPRSEHYQSGKSRRFSPEDFRFKHVLSSRNLAGFFLVILFISLTISFAPLFESFSDKSESLGPNGNPRLSPKPPISPDPKARPEDSSGSGTNENPHTPFHSPNQPSPAVRSRQDASSSHFGLGSTQAEVLRVQGPPTRVHGQTWVYGLSEVQFKDGRVWRYNNFDHSLKIQVSPSESPSREKPSFFTVGSTQDEVLVVQGTPTRMDTSKWYYGFSEVRFKSGRVEDYDNYFGNLRVRLLPADPANTAAQRGYFTIGSTQDEVLAVQGTPTSIQGNFWFYHFSNILFRDGKVQYVVNSAENLHFVPPDELAIKLKESGQQ